MKYDEVMSGEICLCGSLYDLDKPILKAIKDFIEDEWKVNGSYGPRIDQIAKRSGIASTKVRSRIRTLEKYKIIKRTMNVPLRYVLL